MEIQRDSIHRDLGTDEYGNVCELITVSRDDDEECSECGKPVAGLAWRIACELFAHRRCVRVYDTVAA